jgi:lipopolysaccharide transport protein LptA
MVTPNIFELLSEKDGSRTFTINSNEGKLGQNESTMALDGNVRIVASDGLTVKTEHATYADADGMVRAPGPVEFGRGRMNGSGVGFTYDKTRDVLTILDRAEVRMAPDEKGEGTVDIDAGTAALARRDKTIRFERTLHVQRPRQTIDADTGVAHLSDDEKRIEGVDLQGNARIGGSDNTPGSLQALNGQSMNLKYGPDGQVIQHAFVAGAASIQIAGDAGRPGRQIVANSLDISLAADGSTPTALVGRQGVKLTMPAEPGAAARTITADNLDAKGQAGKGLTQARFTGAVDYRETGADVSRAAKSLVLDAALKPGMSEIEEARFSGRVRFEEGAMAATGAAARYDLAKGTLVLDGSEKEPPHMINERIAIDAAHMDVTLAGPKVKAAGTVKSVLRPPKSGDKTDTKMPSMLKQDQPVNVTADELDYDGTLSRALYTGKAVLWQGDTSVKGATITIDDKTGDLFATGPVTTTSMLEQEGQDKKKERVRSIATADDFKYTESKRLAAYTGGAHMTGPQGDITAKRIDLTLKPSGDEVDRAEAFAGDDPVTIKEQNRKTTGAHLVYTAADDRYVVNGKPATNVDACGNETSGSALTFVKATDTIIVDGNGFRTQTKGTGACK